MKINEVDYFSMTYTRDGPLHSSCHKDTLRENVSSK